jgi:sec-independent protein translocase protein TatA
MLAVRGLHHLATHEVLDEVRRGRFTPRGGCWGRSSPHSWWRILAVNASDAPAKRGELFLDILHLAGACQFAFSLPNIPQLHPSNEDICGPRSPSAPAAANSVAQIGPESATIAVQAIKEAVMEPIQIAGGLGGLGFPELLVIGLIFVVLFGGKKLPELAKGLGEGIKNFKTALKEEEKVDEKKQA